MTLIFVLHRKAAFQSQANMEGDEGPDREGLYSENYSHDTI